MESNVTISSSPWRPVRTALSRVACSFALVVVTQGAAHGQIAPGRAVNPMLFGSNQNHAVTSDPMSQNDYRALVRNLGIQSMRYVGGTPSSFWDWQQARFIPDAEILAIAPSLSIVSNGTTSGVNAQPVGTYSVDNFASFAQAADLHATQWVPNLTTREADQPALFQHLHQQGITFDYVEMDNEAYSWAAEFAPLGGGTAYANRVADLAPIIRSLNPQAAVGAVFRPEEFFTGDPTHIPHDIEWNGKVHAERGMPQSPNYDAIILHEYGMVGNRLDGFSTADRAKAFLAHPQNAIERAVAVSAASYGGLPIWITEHNVIAYRDANRDIPADTDNEQFIRETANTGWNALFSAGYLLTAISHPDAVTMLNHHSVFSILGWGLGNPISATESQISATGQTFSHLADIAANADTMHAVNPDHNPALGITQYDQPDPGVFQVVAFTDDTAQQRTLIILNRDDQTQRFELADYGLYREASILTYHAEDAGATGYGNVLLDTDTPIYLQSTAPLTPTVSDSSVVPGDGLDFNVGRYAMAVVTLSNPYVLADLNDDGHITADDVTLFLLARDAGSQGAFELQAGGGAYYAGDTNLDGSVNAADQQSFIQISLNAGVDESVLALIPEPSALAHMLLLVPFTRRSQVRPCGL